MNKYLCIVYVSEGINTALIHSFIDFAKYSLKSSYLVHSFIDKSYNRTSFYFVGTSLVKDLELFCSYVFDRCHQGTHPTLGSIDHICFSPLEFTSLDFISSESLNLCEVISSQYNIPVYCYGKASNELKLLKDIRKSLGYFNSQSTNNGSNTISSILSLSTQPGFILPNFGDINMIKSSKHGIVCIGVVPLVINLNIKYSSIYTKPIISKVTQYIRSPEVQALTLKHDNGSYEVACNLLQPKVITIENVISKVKDISNQLNISFESYYTTDLQKKKY